MLQDLDNGRLLNEYKNITPSEEDMLLSFKGGDILLKREGEKIFLPEFSEYKRGDILNPIYLFEISGTRYFLNEKDEDISISGYSYETARGIRDVVPKESCFAILTAWHLYCWYKNNHYCGRCGEKTMHDEKERMLRCENCGNMIFPKISPAVIIAVTDGDKLLLSKYAGRAYTRYALLAGYTEIGETMEETVKREVMEEVSLSVKNIRYYKSQPWGVDGNVLMGFYCDLDGDNTITIDENELSMAQWFKRGEIPAKDDGFSLTREMIRIFDEGKEPK